MSNRSILIIGGGASGLMAAIAAARNGASVTILERLDRVGKKILATGNGRCNLTNARGHSYFGTDPEFAVQVIQRFSVDQTLAFFTDLGVILTEEEEGRVYPFCGQASAVLDVLRLELERLGVRVECGTAVKRVLPAAAGFDLQTSNGRTISAEKVILATGGLASPQFGSDGSGLRLAREVGHRIVEPVAGLVQLNIEAPFLKQIDGVKATASVSVLDGQRLLRREHGEILFTGYGVSGIPIMQISRFAAQRLSRNQPMFLEIGLMPQLSHQQITDNLMHRIDRWRHKPLDAAMIGFVHKRLIPVVLKASGIKDIRQSSNEVTADEIARIAALAQSWRFRITATQPWARAQVTAGGVATDQIVPGTMESRIIPGLHFAGEVVDIDGDCGGYNLQWAWSSGFVAGTAAAGS